MRTYTRVRTTNTQTHTDTLVRLAKGTFFGDLINEMWRKLKPPKEWWNRKQKRHSVTSDQGKVFSELENVLYRLAAGVVL